MGVIQLSSFNWYVEHEITPMPIWGFWNYPRGLESLPSRERLLEEKTNSINGGFNFVVTKQSRKRERSLATVLLLHGDYGLFYMGHMWSWMYMFSAVVGGLDFFHHFKILNFFISIFRGEVLTLIKGFDFAVSKHLMPCLFLPNHSLYHILPFRFRD